jgi:hypothetical protein
MGINLRMHVDPWDPAYGTGMEAGDGGDGPRERSSAQLDTDVELAADAWHPMPLPAGVSAPEVVYIVDGVRRIDARIWIDTDEQSYPGLAASYAAGVVRCDHRSGVAELLNRKVERGLFTSAPDVAPIGIPPTRYDTYFVSRGEPSDLVNGVQARLHGLEVAVSAAARSTAPDGDDLLIVDGQLTGRAHLPHAIGYVKTHHRSYLPDRLTAVVTGLQAGERSPVFLLGTSWRRHTWYLRLPAPPGSAWNGIVRVECAADLETSEAVALADLSAATLPRFASTPYKDPRAPQNLVPIAGLERRLRGLLGDARLLHRSLLRATATASASGD